MKITFSPLHYLPKEAWVVADGQRTRLRVRYGTDGGTDLIGEEGTVQLPNCTEAEVADYTAEWLEIQARSHLSGIEAQKSFAGYVDPPAHLVPYRGPDDDPAAWDKLLAWFEAHTKRPEAALLVAFCERFKCKAGEAYIFTDGYFKRKHQLDNDGEYVSYN